MKDSLTIKALKYISKRNGEYKPVELKDFLIKNFPEKPNMGERLEMKKFIEFLAKSDFVEFLSNSGLWFIQEAGKKIPKEEISAKVKITSKGFELLRENDKFIINKVNLFLAIIFGISTAYLSWNAYFDNQSIKNLKDKIEILKDENSRLFQVKIHNDSLNKYKVK